MDLDIIRLHKPKLIGEDRVFRTAVCIPLIERDGEYDLLFEVRSGDLDDQPGDICFPGGRIEEEERPEAAAVRELEEELLISGDNNIEVIGQADIFHTENIIVYPYAVVLRDYQWTFNEEVSEVFTVPFRFFIDNEPEKYKLRYDLNFDPDFPFDRINGGRDYKWRGRSSVQLFYQYKERCIWGLTAKLVNAFAGLYR